MKKFLFILFFFPVFLFSKYQVITYFPLESYLVRKIAHEEVKIREISNRYISEYQELPYSEISKLSNAKAYFHFSLDVEHKYAKILKEKNPEIILVDLSSNIFKIDDNPYIWTDPLLLREVAKNIYETLVIINKDKKDFYKKNYEIFLNEIDDTFLRIKQKFRSSETNVIYVFDDYWEYFTRRFRIKTIRREKKYISIQDVPELIKFTQKKDVKKILFLDNYDYNLALSLGTNLNIQIVQEDIFNSNWQINLLELTDKLSK
jgi:zinc transport system substrate-binding protein